MAKHFIDGKGKVSKGLRRSSMAMKRVPVVHAVIGEFTTSMREAFIAGRVYKGTGAAIINQAAKALRHGAGVLNFGKAWNAHLSYKTAQQLKAEGILL